MTVTQVPFPSPSTLKKFPHIHDDPSTMSHALDPFTITTSTGFLPYQTAPVELPAAFEPLFTLINRLPVVKADGTPGLLATYELGHAVDTELPDLTDEIPKLVLPDGSPDKSLLLLYSVTTPSWPPPISSSLAGRTGTRTPTEAMDLAAPFSLSVLLVPCIAVRRYSLDLPPFMSYAASYALFNYTVADKSKGLEEYSNLRLIRAFERGLSPKSSEAGFILTHVDMVKETGPLVNGVLRVIDTIEQRGSRAEINDGFREILRSMEKIEASMEEMWANSKPSDYLSFRVFIFGITNQSMFPNGVIYDGVLDNKPLEFRGESGANDSIIPMLDHLCEIPMPSTPLTKILHEFRAYRPLPHREFLTYIREKAETIGVRKSSTTSAASAGATGSSHASTSFVVLRTPTATGGSPIVTWLPNQLFAVMELMIIIYDTHLAPKQGAAIVHSEQDLIASHRKQVEPMMENVRDQKEKLEKEVEKWCKERGV
ncbi:Indoleamine 2-3-dioxygenase [Penicillium chermesinum]|uniref:Indoleamine 2,3-dioxygenase n=1 Tax=Penicillium chermesinum TaxID=63820 RepID=A0A9W9TJP9_9EURO|nr:Indoleamine 2-3-dioxygenase [Penicillium chermesinum]KAJ5225064.1 Indoleamine 2-3-dioxygenase [Penicillium chermesinum]